MKLIATKLGKSDKYDQLDCVRADGSVTKAMMPRQGVLPHDLIHYVVESVLGYRHGFLGLVAQGVDIAFAMQQTHEIAHRQIAEQAHHAESLVESLQAQLWSGQFLPEDFWAGLEGACAMRGCASPDLSGINPKIDLYDAVLALNQRWLQVPFYATLELEMSHL